MSENKIRILFIVPYPTEGPSNRFRVEQYLSYLKKERHICSIRPFYNSKLYKILYDDDFYIKKFFYFIYLTLRRIKDIWDALFYDVIFIHREAFPLRSTLFEHLFKLLKKKIIFDFDDSIFLPNVSSSNRFVNLFKNPLKIKKIIKISDGVIAGNNFLKEYALKFNKNVYVLPTPIDTEKYFPLENKRIRKEIIIGWIGTVSTLKYLKILKNVFLRMSNAYPEVIFVIIGKNFTFPQGANIQFREWTLESEVSALQDFDIGIMPLTDDEWAKGKCAFKAIQYMSVGIPVVVSNVGMNKELIQNGINGFLVSNEDEWADRLEMLINNYDLRKKIGMMARKTIEEKYSLKVNAPRFLEIIKKVYSEK